MPQGVVLRSGNKGCLLSLVLIYFRSQARAMLSSIDDKMMEMQILRTSHFPERPLTSATIAARLQRRGRG